MFVSLSFHVYVIPSDQNTEQMNLGCLVLMIGPLAFCFLKLLNLLGALTGACCLVRGQLGKRGEGFGNVLPLFLQYSVNTEKAHVTQNW